MSAFETVAVIYFAALLLNIVMVLVLVGGFLAACLVRERYSMWRAWREAVRARGFESADH